MEVSADKLEKALEKAYKEALRILEPAIISPSSSLSITISLEYDERGPITLVIDMELSRGAVRKFSALMEEAAHAAARAVERELGIKARAKLRLVTSRGKEGSYSSS